MMFLESQAIREKFKYTGEIDLDIGPDFAYLVIGTRRFVITGQGDAGLVWSEDSMPEPKKPV